MMMSHSEEIPSEHHEQVLFCQFMKRTYPNIRFFAIPSGGLRNKVVAMNLKAEGVTPGVPDLMLPQLHLFIEMKRQKGGVVSPEQKDWIVYLRSCGYHAEIAKGCEEAKIIVAKYI